MLAILSPILVFGLVIFVHELGHFLAAKAVGVYAPRFSIGFGPAIFKFRRGETEYILAWLPLGGYVRMASRHDAETAFLEGGNEEQASRQEAEPGYDPEAMIPFGPKPVPENRWFESKPLWARIVIMLAGVVMNALLAIVVATVFALDYGKAIYPSTVIGGIQADAKIPELAQLQAGDTVKAVNGTPVQSWNELRRQILGSKGSVAITTHRGTTTIPIREGASTERVADGLIYHISPVIDTIVPGEPAAASGLQRGDSIISVSGKPLVLWSEMVQAISSSAGRPLTLVVGRAGRVESLTVTPKAVKEIDPSTGDPREIGKIGAGPRDPSRREPLGVGEAISAGFQITWDNAALVFRIMHQIGSGKQSVSQLGGPIAITRAAVDAGRGGLARIFELIALLSINVAVFNLLPIPILDGGQILINILESAKGSPFSGRTREYILRFGLLTIALLFAIVMYNDTRAAFAKLFGWVGQLFGA